MPAIDECEPQVIGALEKEDWAVINQPLTLRSGIARKQLFADLYLQKMTTKEQIIVVEIKCFPESRSRIDEFYHAIGQYQVYQIALQLNQITAPLFLAVPTTVYQEFFQEQIIQKTLEKIKPNLVVIDLEKEEITQWKTF